MRLIHRRRFPVQHFVLVAGPEDTEPGELLAQARACAEQLALTHAGGSQNFTLIHNGAGIARRPWPHVHIVCCRHRFGKALAYLLIGLRNLRP